MTTIRLPALFLLLSLTPTLLAQPQKPVIAGPLLHGASMHGTPAFPDHPVGGLAQGSIFTIFGSFLGPQQLVHAAVPYPTQLPPAGGTQVVFRSVESGENFQAYLIYTSQNQVSGIIPSDVPLGLSEVRLSYEGMESEPTLVWIIEANPGIFTVNQTGRGPGVIQNFESPSSQPLNSLTRPAEPGQYIILWSTGLGAIEGPDNIAPPVGNLRDDVVVTFRSSAGIVEAHAEYAGRAPGFPGVDQINVRIPEDDNIELGCYSQIDVTAGVYSGLDVSLAISDTPGECDHPWGLSAAKLAELDAGGAAKFLNLLLGSPDAHAIIAEADATGVALNVGPVRPIGFVGSPFFRPSVCRQSIFLGAPLEIPTRVMPVPVRVSPGLSPTNLGDLRLVGLDLRAVELARTQYDPLSFMANVDLPENFFISGEWRLRSNGGQDADAFETRFHVAALPELELPEVVDKSEDITLSWDPTPYAAGDYISIWLSERNEGQTSGQAVLCDVEASKGTLTIQSGWLQELDGDPGPGLRWQVTVQGEPHQASTPNVDHIQIVSSSTMGLEATLAE